MGQTATASVEVGAGTTLSTFLGQRSERGGLSFALTLGKDRGFDNSGDGGEKDGILRKSGTAKGDFMVTEDLKIGFSLRRSVEAIDYDTASGSGSAAGYVVDDPSLFIDRYETTGRIFAEHSMMDGRLTQRLAIENTQLDQSRNAGSKEATTTNAVKYRLSYGLDGAVADADQLVTLLVERQKDSSSTQPTFNPKATSVALEYRGSFAGGFDVQAGLRRDNNSTYGDTTTWNVGLSYTFAQSGIKLHSSAGTGVLNPRYDQLFDISYGPSFTVFGNPNLKPEENRSFDIGATLPVFGDRGSLDVTYFNEVLTNKIEYDGSAAINYSNATGKNKRQGVEIGGTLQATDALALRFGYTYTDARNDKGATEIRRPRNELTLGATMETFGGRGMVSADLRHVSGNFDSEFWLFPSPVTKLPDFTTVDVAARYDLTDRVALTGRVTNLFDKATIDTWGYANRGRAVYVGLNAKF